MIRIYGERGSHDYSSELMGENRGYRQNGSGLRTDFLTMTNRWLFFEEQETLSLVCTLRESSIYNPHRRG